MKAKGIFISTLLVVDTFLLSYAAGFHSRHVLVVNPKLPPVVQKKTEVKPTPVPIPAKKADSKEGHGKKDPHPASTHGKGSHDSKNSKSSGKPEGTTTGEQTSSGGTSKAAADKPTHSKPGAKPQDSKTGTKPAVKPSVKPAVKPAAKSQAKPQSKPDSKAPAKQIKYDSKNPGA